MEATSALAAGPDPAQFRCLLCNTDTPNRLVMIQHLRSPQHRDVHGQWRLQLLQNGEGTPGLERYICFALTNPSGICLAGRSSWGRVGIYLWGWQGLGSLEGCRFAEYPSEENR